MKRILIIAFFLFVAAFIYAQEIGDPDPRRLGVETAQQQLMEVSVDRFEHEGFWRSTMFLDQGITTTRLLYGRPAGIVPLPYEEEMGISNEMVLGTRVDFLRRGYNSFTIFPSRPIPIEGITKTVSVWVAGRNFNHELYLLVQDFFGRTYQLFMGRLNHMGWRRMTVAIPPQSEDGFSGIVQRNHHFPGQAGIRIVGFRIDTDPMESFGSYFIYFDDLRAVTDLFAEHHRDPDDMVDGW